jgi:hypothetical protein
MEKTTAALPETTAETPPSVKEILEEISTWCGTEGTVQMIENWFEWLLDYSDEVNTVPKLWQHYRLKNALQQLLTTAKTEFEFRH